MIVRNASDAVAKWAGYHLKTEFVPPYEAWGILDKQGRLSAAIVLNDCADQNIELSFVGGEALKRSVFRKLAEYVFDELRCERATVRTRSDNDKVLAIIKKAGFIQEGILRRWYGDADAIVFGMLRNECKYRRP